jgi:hypothetical protein
MNLGPGRKMALLLEPSQPGATPRQVKEGETFGGYKIAMIGDNQVTLEFEGQQKKIEVSTAARQVPPPAVASSAPAPQIISTTNTAPALPMTPQAPPPPNTAQIIPGKQGPSNEPIQGTNSVRAYGNDPLPAGTIINGYIKVERASPFGREVWWQKMEERKPPK